MTDDLNNSSRCIHEMLPNQCAICLKQNLDEEEILIFKGLQDKEQPR